MAVGLLPGLLLYWLSEWWLTRRAQRDWDRGEPEHRRRWAEEDRRQALQQQLQELEEAIREGAPLRRRAGVAASVPGA